LYSLYAWFELYGLGQSFKVIKISIMVTDSFISTMCNIMTEMRRTGRTIDQREVK